MKRNETGITFLIVIMPQVCQQIPLQLQLNLIGSLTQIPVSKVLCFVSEKLLFFSL
jgi:hypothetical protein